MSRTRTRAPSIPVPQLCHPTHHRTTTLHVFTSLTVPPKPFPHPALTQPPHPASVPQPCHSTYLPTPARYWPLAGLLQAGHQPDIVGCSCGNGMFVFHKSSLANYSLSLRALSIVCRPSLPCSKIAPTILQDCFASKNIIPNCMHPSWTPVAFRGGVVV
ncbi:hypothetical protein D9619_009510 [Psilocybe cf. subviscida]|uniref:Uncharacterized protein n=1 Tax=Psilocybe cf. subviscida TaxID=2480587 RepID=A0A8H5BUG5_9AGAR|nr:hypothetical protein D9619_009510 [Psilocybe cf. subviscida]